MNFEHAGLAKVLEYRKNECKEKSGELRDLCKEKEVISSEPKPTTRPYPDYMRLPEFLYLPLLLTPTNDRTSDDFHRAQIELRRIKMWPDSEAI